MEIPGQIVFHPPSIEVCLSSSRTLNLRAKAQASISFDTWCTQVDEQLVYTVRSIKIVIWLAGQNSGGFAENNLILCFMLQFCPAQFSNWKLCMLCTFLCLTRMDCGSGYPLLISTSGSVFVCLSLVSRVFQTVIFVCCVLRDALPT